MRDPKLLAFSAALTLVLFLLHLNSHLRSDGIHTLLLVASTFIIGCLIFILLFPAEFVMFSMTNIFVFTLFGKIELDF
jgi:hypothetical protein